MTSHQHTIIIESCEIGFGGGDRESSEYWIRAANELSEVEKIIIIASNSRSPKSEKEYIHELPFWRQSDKFVFSVLQLVPGSLMLRKAFYYYCYERWLEASAVYAFNLSKSQKVCVAAHVGFSSLIFGTRLGVLRSFGTFTVCTGALPGPVPKTFARGYSTIDRIIHWQHKVIAVATRRNRLVDAIACNDLVSESLVKQIDSPVPEIVVVPEPHGKIEPEPKVVRIFYLDRENIARKGRRLLLKFLQNGGIPPLPIFVISKSPDDWSGFENVTVSAHLNHEEFNKELARSRFVLSTSIREGSQTVIVSGASAGCIPIVTPIVSFEGMPSGMRVMMDSDMEPVAALGKALREAASITEDDCCRMSREARRWSVEGHTNVETLKALLRRWLQAACHDASGNDFVN